MNVRYLVSLLVAAPLLTLPAAAQVQTVTAGANLLIDFNEEVPVPYNGFAGEWVLDVNLIHDPGAGPMFKIFESPITDTNTRIQLDAEQPFPQRVTENFYLPPTLAPILTVPVADWHEEIVTPGWEFVIPEDSANFPRLFPPNASLITKNGNPHPWDFIGSPQVDDITRLDVMFPPIAAGNTLDIHKALLWVGTPGNRIWGDDMLDDGTFLDESTIRVWGYPTVPEPSAICLVGIAICVGVASRWTSMR